MNARRFRIAVALGKLGSRVHGTLDAANPFDNEGSFATGTVSGFWTLVWGLAELGHLVDAFADVKEEIFNIHHLGGASVFNISAWENWKTKEHPRSWGTEYDAYVSILESDLLDLVPKSHARICVQWLNDFSYSRANPLETVDTFVSPSLTHADHLAMKVNIPRSKIAVVPLSNNPELFNVATGTRRPHSVAYASSPDRGLHHLLEMWPEIRRRVPDAELRVYYRLLPWLEDILGEPAHRGSKNWKRAKVVKDSLDQLGSKGENGVFLVGPLTTSKMATELRKTEVLAYPCDPVKFTEGFSVTILDACAAGCMPIVSDVDAFPELWAEAAEILPRPSEPNASMKRSMWIDSIVSTLVAPEFVKVELQKKALARASQLTRRAVAAKWDVLIRSSIALKETEAA